MLIIELMQGTVMYKSFNIKGSLAEHYDNADNGLSNVQGNVEIESKFSASSSGNGKKILLICLGSRTIITFRKGLIKALLANGYNVSIIAFDNEYESEIVKLGVEFYFVQSENRSLNPMGMLRLEKEYYSLIKKIMPDIVFTFMLKPNIFGVRAAKKAGIQNIFSMVEGAGDAFINNSAKWKVIRLVVCKLYKGSFKHAKKVLFLNSDDSAEFLNRKLVKERQISLVPGIGVDVNYFAYKPVKNFNTFLMIARMLNTKGVIEYCKAARIVKTNYLQAVFNYLGGEGNIKIADIQEYIDDGSINYLGTTNDVRPFIEDCSVFVLPTYREGMPMSVMEAESVGRAILATNVPGCKDQIRDNGFLVEKQNVNALVEKMKWFLDNPDEIVKMGKNSRKIAEEVFSDVIINAKVLNIISDSCD